MTNIEWTHRGETKGESWNMIGGCTKVSEGCSNCYALRDSWRIQNNPKRPDRYEGVCEKVNGDVRWTGRINLDWDAVTKPLHWRKPRTVFVASMSDLFHKDVPFDFIGDVWQTMFNSPKHTFQVLTKRPQRARQWFDEYWIPAVDYDPEQYVLPNVWLGVTAENQKQADKRIPILADIPARVRFVSAEPLLGPIDFSRYLDVIDYNPQVMYYEEWPRKNLLSWCITGGESGHNARPMHPQWARDIRDQCLEHNVAYFHKQNGEWIKQRAVPGDDWTHVTFMDEEGNIHEPTNNLEFWRVGKKRAGRLLDGKEWSQFPKV